MAPRIEFSSAALSDLDDIAFYGAMEFGLSAARQYVRALEEGLKLLAAFPDASPAIASTDGRVRLRSVKSHRFVYKVQPDGGVLILRILHARQLPPELA